MKLALWCLVLIVAYALLSRRSEDDQMSEDWLRRFIGETPHDGRARDSWRSPLERRRMGL